MPISFIVEFYSFKYIQLYSYIFTNKYVVPIKYISVIYWTKIKRVI